MITSKQSRKMDSATGDAGRSSSDQYGLEILSDSGSAIVDVVFVHGLTGGRRSTWTKKTKGGSILWPEQLLPTDLPSARILTFGYDADIVKLLKSAGSNTLRDHGKSLAMDLSRLRRRTSTTDRPVIFVGHSLGGLVCEQALLISRGATEPYLNELLEATYAIAFLGTPHAGSDLAVWGKILTGLSGLVKQTNSAIVAVLKPGYEMLQNVQEEFHAMLQARSVQGKPEMRIFCFYEELPVAGVGQIVPSHSAVIPRYPSQSVHANHMDMARFSDRNENGYRMVSDQLWIWTDEIQKTRSLARPRVEDVRRAREARFSGGSQNEGPWSFTGTINSGGGSVHVGDQQATGNIINKF